MFNALFALGKWFLAEAFLKVLLMGAVFVVLTVMLPIIASLIAPMIGISSLNAAISGLPQGVLWFGGLLRLDVGLPAVVAAVVTKFFIRRLPFIG